MRQVLLVLLLASSLIVPLLAQAVTATYTLTAAEKAAVDKLVTAENARRAALVPPLSAVTAQQYANASCKAPFKDYADQENEAAVVAADIKARWIKATSAQRAAALAQLPPE